MTKQNKVGITAGNSIWPNKKFMGQMHGSGKRKTSGNQ